MRYKCNLLSCSSLCCLSCRFWAQAIVVLIKLSTGWLAEFDSLNLQFTCTLVRSVLRLYVVLRGACIQSTAHRSRLRLFGSTFAAPRNCDLQKLANVMSFDVAQLFCNCNVKNFFWLKLIFFCICPLSGIAAALASLTCVAAMTRQRYYTSSFAAVAFNIRYYRGCCCSLRIFLFVSI